MAGHPIILLSEPNDLVLGDKVWSRHAVGTDFPVFEIQFGSSLRERLGLNEKDVAQSASRPSTRLPPA